MPILDPSFFEEIFLPLRGKRVGFVPLEGWAGDELIHESTRGLFRHFDVEFEDLPTLNIQFDDLAERFDEIAVSGGGNMGGPLYPGPFETRKRLIETGLPITVLPQTFIQNEEDLKGYDRVFVRENESQKLNPQLPLAPDLALGYLEMLEYDAPSAPVGVFLREDAEQRFGGHPTSLGDPADLATTVNELFDLAARFEHIVTDRLHFCIAGILLDRRVTLLPNSYFKNRAFYETWLSELCDWSDNVPENEASAAGFDAALLQRLVGPPTRTLDESAVPVQEPGYFLDESGNGFKLTHADGVQHVECNMTAAMVWKLSTGDSTVGEIVQLLTEAFPDAKLQVARDVHESLHQLLTVCAIVIDTTPEPLRDLVVMASSGTERTLTLRIHELSVRDGALRLSASLNDLDLWFAVKPELREYLTRFGDPFVLIALMIAMREEATLVVRGAPLSTGLLRNLEQFQKVWAAWRLKLTAVEIHADEVEPPLSSRRGAISAFSGGVDSCYTVYRHIVEPVDRFLPELEAALLIQGFDFDTEDREKLDHSFTNATKLLDGTGLQLLSVQTNVKEFLPNWLDSHGLMLGACLCLFSGGFETGVVGSTLPYSILQPLGSNPITDRMMGSDLFSIFHHGAEMSRLDKIRAISQWDRALPHLRVCWEGTSSNILNCGECLACVLTSIMFHCIGHHPGSLPRTISSALAASVLNRHLGRLEWHDIRCVLAEAAGSGLDAPWIGPLQAAASKTRVIPVM